MELYLRIYSQNSMQDKTARHEQELEQVQAYLAALQEELEKLLTENPEQSEQIKKLIELLMEKLHISEGEQAKQQLDDEASKKRKKNLLESVSDDHLEVDAKLRQLLVNAKIIRLAILGFVTMNPAATSLNLSNKCVNMIINVARISLPARMQGSVDIYSRVFKAALLRTIADLCIRTGRPEMFIRAQGLLGAVIALDPRRNQALRTAAQSSLAIKQADVPLSKDELKIFAKAQASLEKLEHKQAELQEQTANKHGALEHGAEKSEISELKKEVVQENSELEMLIDLLLERSENLAETNRHQLDLH